MLIKNLPNVLRGSINIPCSVSPTTREVSPSSFREYN